MNPKTRICKVSDGWYRQKNNSSLATLNTAGSSDNGFYFRKQQY